MAFLFRVGLCPLSEIALPRRARVGVKPPFSIFFSVLFENLKRDLHGSPLRLFLRLEGSLPFAGPFPPTLGSVAGGTIHFFLSVPLPNYRARLGGFGDCFQRPARIERSFLNSKARIDSLIFWNLFFGRFFFFLFPFGQNSCPTSAPRRRLSLPLGIYGQSHLVIFARVLFFFLFPPLFLC